MEQCPGEQRGRKESYLKEAKRELGREREAGNRGRKTEGEADPGSIRHLGPLIRVLVPHPSLTLTLTPGPDPAREGAQAWKSP